MARKIGLIRNSRFLGKEDCSPPITLTIDTVTEENVAADGMADELKYVVSFRETDQGKGLVLNWTNAQLISRVADSDDMDEWGGTVIELFHDPNISFGKKLVGGIRVRTAPRTSESFNDDIPYT